MDYAELIRAHALYESKYGNNFYRIALNVCQRGGIEEKTMVIASFLIYFNKVWYMHSDDGKNAFNNPERHVSDIYEIIRTTTPIIEELKDVSLIDANLDNAFIESSIKTLYKKFSNVFGATGASKALHLLHPKLFGLYKRLKFKVFRNLVAHDSYVKETERITLRAYCAQILKQIAENWKTS